MTVTHSRSICDFAGWDLYSRFTRKDAPSGIGMDNPSNYQQRGVIVNVDCSVVGIDVGKDSSYFCVLTPGGLLHRKPTKITNDAKGLTKLVTCLRKTEETLGTKPAILLESTGHYSERLVCFFIRNNFRVFLINPL